MRINLRFFGAVRANSLAVLLPIPEEAPVINTVLPSSLFAAVEALRVVVYSFGDRGIGGGRCTTVARRIWESVWTAREGIWIQKQQLICTIEEVYFEALCSACGELSTSRGRYRGSLGSFWS